MKNFRRYAVGIIIPLAVGGLSALLTSGAMKEFEAVAKPAFSPPGWLFPVAWSFLYILMGVSSVLVGKNKKALAVYGLQLGVNFFWSIFFFGFGLYLFSFVWLLVLWVLVLCMIVIFAKIKPAAAFLNFPYLLWLTFAGYLNYGVYMLNS